MVSSAPVANAGRLARKRLVRLLPLALGASIAGLLSGAGQDPPAAQFAGTTTPNSPGQGQPWTAPTTKLPKFLVSATRILFDQGVADPRGCEYRQVEVGGGSIAKVHGFVLPERADVPGRFVVCWDGQVHPALAVGHPADLERDISDLVKHLKQAREAAKLNRSDEVVTWSFPESAIRQPLEWVSVDDRSPIKLCLLLRLGRANLAESLFAAGTTWTPGLRVRDLTDYRISYITLAVDWASAAFDRLIAAHVRSDDVIALDVARKLTKFRDLASATAEGMGYTRPERRIGSVTGPTPWFSFLTQLDDLLRDQERRAKTPSRRPVPAKEGNPAARVADLIRDLDQIGEGQTVLRGIAPLSSSPAVERLVAIGDPAVAPLLDALESDNRLTRAVTPSRSVESHGHFVHPVSEVAFVALLRILQTDQVQNQRFDLWNTPDPVARKNLAASIRQFWQGRVRSRWSR